jgi:predicted permease
LESVFKDLKQPFRMFRQTPGFTLTAIAALALGIGVNTAIFSVVNAVLLRPINAPDPDRVVAFVSTSREGSAAVASEIKFNLWREQTGTFKDVSGYYFATLNLTGVDLPQQAEAAFVSRDYFRLFGLSVAHGRGFTNQEMSQAKGVSVAVISNSFWHGAFGGDPHILGKSISLSGERYQVIGVMRPGAQAETPAPIDVWLPFYINPNSTFQAHYFQGAGRLQQGIALGSANAQLQLTTEEFRRKFPNTISTHRGDVMSVAPMRDVLVGDTRPSLIILTSAVTLVLLIACANVASLLLVKATGRTREIAIRVAVGASRLRIVRQLLTESVLLSMAGAVLGLMIGIAGIHALLALNAAHLPRIGVRGDHVTLDWRVMLFTVSLALITGLLFGLMPALQATKSGLERTGRAVRQRRPRSLLVISEMSLALLLLIGAALLIRTFIALRSVNPGFEPRNVVIARTSLDSRLAGKSGVDEIVRDIFRRLSILPGVDSIGYTWMLPLSGDFNSLPIIVAGRPLNAPSHGQSRWVVVSSTYFNVLKIPLLQGRLFSDADRLGSPGVAIVNQAMARQFWPNGHAMNSRIFIGRGLGANFDEPAREVIGVIGDIRDESLGEATHPAVYVPGAQLADRRLEGRGFTWVVRTRGPSQALEASILRELRQATGEPVAPIRSMEQIISQSTARQNLNMLLMSIFGGSALLLAAIGIYGLMAYSVQQRTRDIGVRMALGAQSDEVRNMVILEGMSLAMAGVAIGVMGAFGLTRFLANFLFGVQALDPLVFITAPVVLSGIALLAVWLPARRASRIDPIVALRYE